MWWYLCFDAHRKRGCCLFLTSSIMRSAFIFNVRFVTSLMSLAHSVSTCCEEAPSGRYKALFEYTGRTGWVDLGFLGSWDCRGGVVLSQTTSTVNCFWLDPDVDDVFRRTASALLKCSQSIISTRPAEIAFEEFGWCSTTSCDKTIQKKLYKT